MSLMMMMTYWSGMGSNSVRWLVFIKEEFKQDMECKCSMNLKVEIKDVLTSQELPKVPCKSAKAREEA